MLWYVAIPSRYATLRRLSPFPRRDRRAIYPPMANPPDKPKKPKDPAKPTRAKAAREQLPPIAPALEKLLNPGIEKGTAGPGSQTGLKPPPDNSFDRRADFAAAHQARASTVRGFNEAPQSGYVGKTPVGPLDPDLARKLGIEEEDPSGPAEQAPAAETRSESTRTGAKAPRP